MLECWESDKNKRPNFAEIVSDLDKIIRSPEVLTKKVSLAPDTKWVNIKASTFSFPYNVTTAN